MRQKKIMPFAMSFCIRSSVFLIDDKCVCIYLRVNPNTNRKIHNKKKSMSEIRI